MRTIVGGRPSSDGDGGRAFSRGIEVLLLKASVDPGFKDLLVHDWRAAAESISLDLAPAERAILESVPGPVLVEMAAKMRVPAEHRPVFTGKVAAAMLTVLAAMAAVGCSPPPPPPQPAAGPERNEPGGWRPPVAIGGATYYLYGSKYPFESEDAVPEPGDGDPREVNEPPAWHPPMAIFGVAPEWNEREHGFESEDEAPPEVR